jgi:diaminohydroxyphosphoribosylaminopyrimidine deaminase/5-amino-6-(5-phosphoribosylamino)uracil reductase
MNVEYMKRAFELAEKGRGRTSPNPLVGAVIVKGAKIVGEGFHEKAGMPHAEINALREAEESARGAAMYVTLEPCCFYGRTPPCTEAIKEAGIKEVIVGLMDPNPKVCGKGISGLEDAGIKVQVGILSEKISTQNEIYIKHITTGYPFVLMKAAMSLDGKIALHNGEQARISSEASLMRVHELRAEYDAIMVGIGTVLADGPLLTARISEKKPKNPLRIIVDSALRIPLESRIVKTAAEIKTLVACANAEEERKNRLQEGGIDILDLPQEDGKVNLSALLKELGKREVASVLLEGGSKLNASAFKAGLVDKILLFIAPIFIGNRDAPCLIDSNIDRMEEAHKLRISGVQRSNGDLVIEVYPLERPNFRRNRSSDL